MPHSRLIRVAPLYPNPAVGLKNQPHFVNTVAHIKTRLPPLTLLSHCQSIESRQGRVRKRKWGARTIDIDLISYGDKKIHHPRLILPHPRRKERDFVSIPLNYLQQ